MKSAVETLSPTRVRLTVEVPFDELKPSVDAAYRKIARQIRVPGFRPGKVPPRILDQRVGRGAVLEEAVNEAVPNFYGAAVRETGVSVLGNPEVALTKFADGDDLVFTAEVDVRPRIELPDYSGIEVSVDSAEVSDAEIDEQLAGLRERFAVLRAADRPVQTGDYVLLDIAATVDGEEVPGGTATGMSYKVGDGNLLPGLDDALVGATEAESKTFDTELSQGDYAGRTAQVAVTVRSVKEMELPELDDEFAQTASEFDTIADLRNDIRVRLTRVKRLQQGVQARDRVLEALLELAEVPLPEAVVDAETDYRRRALDEQLTAAGLSWDDWLVGEGKTEEEVVSELQEGARKAVKAQFLLESIAEKEALGVSEAELTDQVVRRAQRAGVAADAYARTLVESGGVGSIWSEVQRGKALALVLEQAVVTDPAGQRIDLESLRSDAFPDQPAASSEAEADGEPDNSVAASTGASEG